MCIEYINNTLYLIFSSVLAPPINDFDISLYLF